MSKKKSQLEYLNTLRFLAVLFICFAHFNYQCFSKVVSNNILEQFFYHNNYWTYYLFYGYTGKYAVAMMCIISGFLVAMKFKNTIVDFGNFILKRYIRLMLPILIVNSIFVIIQLIKGNTYTMSEYLLGSLYPGSKVINEHLYCIGEFLIGNIIVGLITYLFKKNKFQNITFMILIPILYKMEKIWIMTTLIGGLTYHLSSYLKETNRLKYQYLLLFILIIWYLPRGDESNKIYLRYAISSMLVIIAIYCLPKLQTAFKFSKIEKLKKCSYSLFVIHGLVNSLIGQTIVESIKNLNMITNVYLLEIITFIPILLIDILLAMLVNYLVEQKLYYKIINKMSNQLI